MIIVVALVVTGVLVFLPFAEKFWEDPGLRFALFVVIICLLALVLLRWALPPGSEYLVMPPLEEVTPRAREVDSIRSALEGDAYHQLMMYLQLKELFMQRVRTRRRMDQALWSWVLGDRQRWQRLVADPDLYLLTALEDVGTTDLSVYDLYHIQFGEGFPARFDALLKKVEGWS